MKTGDEVWRLDLGLRKEGKIMRKAFVMFLLLPLLAGVTWGQSKGPSVVIVQKSQTDKPAGPGQTSSDANAVAHFLEDQIAIRLQEQQPCVNAITDRDASALLDWERQRQLLGGDDNAALSALAGSLGAKYIISVSVTQLGGKTYLKASCINSQTAQTVAMKDKVTGGGDDTVHGVDSLALDFVNELGGLFAVKPQAGKTYPVGVTMQLVCTYPGASYLEQTWSEYQHAKKSGGYWNDEVGGSGQCVYLRPPVQRLTEPGRYRLVICRGKFSHCENREIGGEFTVEGSCKK
jgi:hypothetical protein